MYTYDIRCFKAYCEYLYKHTKSFSVNFYTKSIRQYSLSIKKVTKWQKKGTRWTWRIGDDAIKCLSPSGCWACLENDIWVSPLIQFQVNLLNTSNKLRWSRYIYIYIYICLTTLYSLLKRIHFYAARKDNFQHKTVIKKKVHYSDSGHVVYSPVKDA